LTRCEKFWEVVQRLEKESKDKKELKEKLQDFCGKSQNMLNKIVAHKDFVDEHLQSGTNVLVSEGATREVRSEPQEIQDQVIPKIQEAVQKGEKVTTPIVKQWVNEAKNPDFYNEPIPKLEECQEDVCPTCQPLSLKENFCPICPKTCDTSATNCPVIAFIKWNGGE